MDKQTELLKKMKTAQQCKNGSKIVIFLVKHQKVTQEYLFVVYYVNVSQSFNPPLLFY